jgi:Leucine-rich repeat (LRR) protein
LDLGENRLEYLHPDTFSNNSYLWNIDISKNRINFLHPDTFRNTKDIVKILAGGNAITSLHPTTFRDSSKLRILDVSNNKLTNLNPDTFKNTDLRYLDLSNNEISSFHPDIFKNNLYLRELNLNNNTLSSLNPNIFRSIPALWKLDVSGNKIVLLDSDTLYNNTELYYFNISYNRINALDPGIFLNNINLRIVDLSHNVLTFQNNNPILVAPKLSVLFLGFCSIKHLNIAAFQNLTMLRILGLNNNYLETLEDDSKKQPLNRYSTAGRPLHILYALKELETLDISNNKLRSLTVNLVSGHEKLIWLSLSGNPVYCDCKLKELWRWCFGGHARTHIASCDKLETCSWEYVRGLSCDATNRSISHLSKIMALICVSVVVLLSVAVVCKVVPRQVLQEVCPGLRDRIVTCFSETFNAAVSSCLRNIYPRIRRKTGSTILTPDDM